MNPMIRRLSAATFLTLATLGAQAATLDLDGVNSRRSSTFDGQPSTVNILNIPHSWAWKSVVVQFNSYSGVPLDIEVTVGTVARRYRGYTIQVALPDPGASQLQLSVKDAGGSNTFDATWWLSHDFGNSSVPVSGTGIPSGAVIAGQEGVPATFSSTSAPVVIYGRPSRPHNVLHVKFESADGNPMSGMVAIGNAVLGLSGTVREFDLSPGAARSATLGIQNPTGAPIRVTWTAVDKTPSTLAMPRTDSAFQKGFSSRYDFSAVAGGPGNVVVRYDSATFPTGRGPSMTKYDVLPSSVDADTAGTTLSTWEIHGDIAPGKRAVAVMPVPVDLAGMPDSLIVQEIQIRHLVASTNQWETIAIDSIRNGCMYFTTSSFSWFRSALRATKRAVVGGVVGGLAAGPAGLVTGAVAYAFFPDVVVDVGGDALGKGAAILGDVADAAKAGYTWLRNGFCDYIVGPVVNAVSVPVFASASWSFAAIDPDATGTGGQPVVRPEGNLDRFFPTAAPPSAPTGWKSIRGNPAWGPAISAIEAESRKPLVKIESDWQEEQRFDSASMNVRVLLDDQLLRSLDQGVPKQHRRFGFTATSILDSLDPKNVQTLPINEYLVFNFKWANLVARISPLIKSCEASLNPVDPIYKVGGHVKDMFKGLLSKNGGQACREVFGINEELFGMLTAQDTRDCISSAKHLKDWMRTQNWEEKKDKAYLGAVDYLTEFDLLLWMNASLRFQLAENMTAFVSQFAEYHDFIRIMMEGNNIPIKGEFALGFHELLMGGTDPTRFRKAATFLSPRLGDHGGYAEGSSYLEYVNQTVFPLLNVAVREGWVQKSVLPDNYYRSGDWLLSITGANGNRAAVDDAVNTKAFTAGYASFAENTDVLDRFMAASSAPTTAREILSLPALDWTGAPPAARLESEFVDGVGMLRGVGLDGHNWSMSIIAESGPLLEMGHGHDQQDNGAIALASDSDPGKAGVIVDPGYDGYENRKNTAYYEHHSVMGVEGVTEPVSHNTDIDTRDAWHLLDDLGAGFGHVSWKTPLSLLMDFVWVYNGDVGCQDHGGGPATLESVFNFLHFPDFRQVSIDQSFDNLYAEHGRRTTMFAGGNFIVLDQLQSRQPAPMFNYDSLSEELVGRFQAFGRRSDTWSARQDAKGRKIPQHGMDPLNLGTISFHPQSGSDSPKSVLTFIPTGKSGSAHACGNARDVYDACVEFTGRDGVVWTILANDYQSSLTLTFNDPIWGTAKSVDRYLVRQFNPTTMETAYLTATDRPLVIDGTVCLTSTGLTISRDGTVRSTAMSHGTKLSPRMSLPLIRRMLD